MSNSPASIGYVMSSSQLNELWHYDMWLANILMDLPLRTCTAEPIESPHDFPAMDPGDFFNLKKQIRAMWIFASHHFFCKQGTHGWGLYFLHDGGNSPKPFTGTKSSILGWLAKVPSVDKCPTGHRYLRSPCCDDSNNIYLGGPISLSNFDPVSRVTCTRCISSNEPRRFKIAVSKTPGRKIVAGHEVLWSYCLDAAGKDAPNFYHVTEWQQDLCCSEVEQSLGGPALTNQSEVVARQPSTPESQLQDQSSLPLKKRKMGGPKPKTSIKCVENFKLCTYCGINLASELTVGRKDSMKRHWALKHTLQLCKEMGCTVDDENNPVSAKEFVKHLDKVTNVFNSLNDHNYKIVPACNYFEITDTPMLNSEASDEAKLKIFNAFIAEGRSSFQKYQVLYLKGIMVPENYEDLLKPAEFTNYSSINWEDTRPSTNNFSINHYQLDEEEAKEHALDIKSQLTNAVLTWVSM